jgi:hypothetical protein
MKTRLFFTHTHTQQASFYAYTNLNQNAVYKFSLTVVLINANIINEKRQIYHSQDVSSSLKKFILWTKSGCYIPVIL